MSRLAEFIRENTDHILSEWEMFAASLPAGASMDISGLRDHAAGMLESIAGELERPKPPQEQAQEAKGKTDTGDDASAAAQSHGAARAERGFTVGEMVAEFRALRATVIRLWTEKQRDISRANLDEMAKFHEAIDQAIAESITRYTRDLGRSKDRFLAILGHDLRTPLSAVSMTAGLILETTEPGEPTLGHIKMILKSAERMNQMIGDVLDFARSQFGQGIPIVRANMNLGRLVSDVVDEIRASHPSAHVNVGASGELHGDWDATRLAQALTNLVANAVHHGPGETPINVAAQGMAREVVVSIQNQGPPIPREKLQQILGATGQSDADRAGGDHLGLGLYIAGEIVKAHGGTIDASSSAEKGTIFTVHLPRQQPTVERRPE
jgi:signal transduction histidine kinase